MAPEVLYAVFLVGCDFPGERQPRVEAQVGNGDVDGLLVSRDFQAAHNAAFISGIIGGGDGGRCAGVGGDVLRFQHCGEFRRNAGGQGQCALQSRQQTLHLDRVVDHAAAGNSAMPVGRQFHGNRASISVIFVRPATMRSSTSVR